MTDQLAGRLRWERTGLGIRVDIPAKSGWGVLFMGFWLAAWGFGGWKAISSALSTKPDNFLYVWLLFWAVALVFVSMTIIWSLAGKTTLTLDSGNLDLTRSVAGFAFSRRSFRTSDVRNLRFQPASGAGRSRRESQLCFEAADKTIRFASGIRDAEAFALIDRMLEVYAFPKERALEYIDLSR